MMNRRRRPAKAGFFFARAAPRLDGSALQKDGAILQVLLALNTELRIMNTSKQGKQRARS
jgi:hypothetical protein